MNTIKVTKLSLEDKRITVEYDVAGSDEWVSYFYKPYILYAEYNFSVEKIPYSVAIIPFVSFVLPMLWVFDAELTVDEIDKAYYESIPEFKKGFAQLHPKFTFGGKIKTDKISENHSVVPATKVATFFSGGIDATYTLISHLEEKPIMLTIWGADMPADNVDGWKTIYSHAKRVADMFELELQTVRTNFSVAVDKSALTLYVQQTEKKSNWYEHFMYGLTFFGHMAPIVYTLGIYGLYMASSNTPDDIGKYTCSSDPIIDNYIRIVDSCGIHDGFETDRQTKVHKICEYMKNTDKKLPLRVCYYTANGQNCCKCEKCCRSMLAIIAEGENPQNYGFELYNDEVRAEMMHNLRKKYWVKYRFGGYNYIQTKIRNTYTYKECPDDLKWFYNLKMKRFYPKWVGAYKFLSKIAHKALNLLHIKL